MADKSIAVRGKIHDQQKVEAYFTRKRWRDLYRSHILMTRGRTPSDRECDLALEEAMEDTDGSA